MIDSYHEKIGQLGAFLARTDEYGYTFASATDQRLIPPANQALREWVSAKTGKTLGIVHLDPADENTLVAQLEQTLGDALIVVGLDAWAADSKHLQAFNFARESLYDLRRPILFWATPDTLSRIGFQAADIFRQRRMTHVFFEEKAEDFSTLDPFLHGRFQEEFRSKTEHEALRLALHLREQQLRDVQQAGMPPPNALSLSMPCRSPRPVPILTCILKPWLFSPNTKRIGPRCSNRDGRPNWPAFTPPPNNTGRLSSAFSWPWPPHPSRTRSAQ